MWKKESDLHVRTDSKLTFVSSKRVEDKVEQVERTLSKCKPKKTSHKVKSVVNRYFGRSMVQPKIPVKNFWLGMTAIFLNLVDKSYIQRVLTSTNTTKKKKNQEFII